MAKTPEQVNKEVDMNKPPTATAIAENTPRYPWGLCLSIENEQLDKLDLDGDCEVGDVIHLCCMAKVTSVSCRETEGKEDRRIELQVTDIAVEDEDRENEEAFREERGRKRYGEKDAA